MNCLTLKARANIIWRCRASLAVEYQPGHQRCDHDLGFKVSARAQVLTALQGLRSLAVNRCPRIGDKGLLIVQRLSHLTSLNCYGCVKACRIVLSGSMVHFAT